MVAGLMGGVVRAEDEGGGAGACGDECYYASFPMFNSGAGLVVECHRAGTAGLQWYGVSQDGQHVVYLYWSAAWGPLAWSVLTGAVGVSGWDGYWQTDTQVGCIQPNGLVFNLPDPELVGLGGECLVYQCVIPERLYAGPLQGDYVLTETQYASLTGIDETPMQPGTSWGEEELQSQQAVSTIWDKAKAWLWPSTTGAVEALSITIPIPGHEPVSWAVDLMPDTSTAWGVKLNWLRLMFRMLLMVLMFWALVMRIWRVLAYAQ